MLKAPPEAFRNSDLFETGIGYVVVSRYKADGRAEAGFFLLDVFCLGVKDAGYNRFSDRDEFEEELLRPLFRQHEIVTMTPAAGRKLVEGAAAYARTFGLGPAADYKKASRVFGGISTAECDEQFVFGHEGRPFFIAGPNDSPSRRAAIHRVLASHCGPDKFGFEVADDFDDSDDSDDFEELDSSTLTSPSVQMGSALDDMARRLQAKRPESLFQMTPPDRPPLSDRLAEVAAPLADEAPSQEARKAALYFAALAWNVAVSKEENRRELLENFSEFLGTNDAIIIFDTLVARTAALFPEEDRIICALEVEFRKDGRCDLRVASISAADNPSHSETPREIDPDLPSFEP